MIDCDNHRARAERALRAARRFREMFQRTPAAIAVMDPYGMIRRANERFCQLVGYSAAELRTMDDPIGAISHPDDVDLERARITALSTGKMASFELNKRYIHRNGHEVRAVLRVGTMRDDPAQSRELIAVAEEPDARQRAREHLEASEGHLQQILDSLAGHAIFAMDRERRITRWSAGARGLLGYAEWEVIGELADLIYPADDLRAEIPQQETQTALEEGQAYDERWHVRKDGSQFWGSGLVNPLLEEDGQAHGFVKIVRDLTEERRNQELLRVRERQKAAIARFGQRALSGVALEDLYEEAAHTVAELLGAELCEVLRLMPDERALQLEAGAGWADGLVGHARVGVERDSQAGYTLACAEPVVVEDLRTETRFHAPALLRDADVISGMSVLIPGRERPWGVLGAHSRQLRQFTADDVNFLQAMSNNLAAAIERAETEQRLREFNQRLETRVAERTVEVQERAAKLQALTTELTQTEQRERHRLAQMLHDHLQQLLVASKMHARTALDASDDMEPVVTPLQQVEDFLEQAIQESRSLTAELSPTVLYEQGLTAGLEWLGRRTQEQHGLAVAVEASPDADPAGEVVRVLLFQTARELLFNVVKHADTGHAEVTLRRDDARRIELAICDRGKGIAPEAAESSTAAEEGGFGLPSIRERIMRLGGDFQIGPRPGGGTCATVAVPDSAA